MGGYIYTHTQYTRSHNTADNWGLISVRAASNSGKIFCFKFWHEISCRLAPSLLFPAHADSFGWLPSTLRQTWGSTAEQRREEGSRASPLPHLPHRLLVGFGAGDGKASPPSHFHTERGRPGAAQEDSAAPRVDKWTLLSSSFCPIQWKERNLLRTNPKIPETGCTGKEVPQVQEALGCHTGRAKLRKGQNAKCTAKKTCN